MIASSRRWSWLALVVLVGACDTPAPPVDASADVTMDAARCASDTSCDDGLFCDGVERCLEGTCVPGVAMRCDDALDCTIDACSEDMRGCTSRVPDLDRDGSDDATCLDATGTPLGDDCADDDGERFPGNEEVCDAAAHDEDCDATTYGGNDVDGDGFEDDRCCNGDACGDDCADTRAGTSPDATEVCNLVDDDCDGNVDEGVAVEGFVDADRDGYGDADLPRSACGTAPGFSPYDTDCADDDVARNPGQPEICDLVDNDCDTTVDEDAAAVTWYADRDHDGFGDAASGTVSSCAPVADHALLGTDCDDAAPAISPAAAELCNGVDDDCSGVADYVITVGDLEDDDFDRVADAACGGPRGLDCDDRDAASTPASAETCDGRDNDCDRRVDEGATSVAFYRDVDGDGFGTDAMPFVACSPPAGFVRRGGDCDDASVAVRPGSRETCDAVDQDCDGAVDEAEASSTCTLAHATSVCVRGRCEVAVCDAGFGDCSTATGCESDTLTDPLHCGSCTACDAASTCTLGRCGPRLGSLIPLGASATNDVIVNDVEIVPGSSDVIVVGAFRGTLGFTSQVLTSLGGLDGFAARVRPNGSTAWAARWGGALDDEMTAIGIEPTTSALVLGGNLCGAVDVCGGPVGSGTRCVGFWQRFPSVAATGCPYATILDGTVGTRVRTLAMERVGMQTFVYVGGAVSGASSALSVSSTVDYDGFVARFVETTSATRQWTRQAASIYPDDVSDLALDRLGRVVAVGTTNGSIDYGLGAGAFAGYSDGYVFAMARATGVPATGAMFGTSNGYDTATRIVVDDTNAYVSGRFGAPAGASTLLGTASNGGPDGYLTAFALASLAPSWTRAIGSAGDDWGIAGLALFDGGPVVTGGFRGVMTLGGASFDAGADADGFVAAYDATGAVRWARRADGTGDVRSVGAARRADGSVAWLTAYPSDLSVLGSSISSRASTDVGIATLVF